MILGQLGSPLENIKFDLSVIYTYTRRNHGILKKQSQSGRNFSKYFTKPKPRTYEIKGKYIQLGK